jgi:hypothetical protein
MLPGEFDRQSLCEVLRSSMSTDKKVRELAEASLARYESNIAPGYLGTLVQMAAQPSEVPEARALRFESS